RAQSNRSDDEYLQPRHAEFAAGSGRADGGNSDSGRLAGCCLYGRVAVTVAVKWPRAASMPSGPFCISGVIPPRFGVSRVGIEPTTDGLKVRCSAAELPAHQSVPDPWGVGRWLAASAGSAARARATARPAP